MAQDVLQLVLFPCTPRVDLTGRQRGELEEEKEEEEELEDEEEEASRGEGDGTVRDEW